MRSINWKGLVPVFAALALFYVLSVVYFSPVIEGKQLVQSDKRNWQGMAQEIQEHRDAYEGDDPLWTGSMFSGMPAYQIAVMWPKNMLALADEVFHGFLPRPANFLFLYLVGMFILLRCLKVDPWLSLVGAIAFGFSSYFFVILDAGHNSKANAIGYMPMVLGAIYLLYRGRMILGAALLALFMGLEIAMNHIQVTYYLGILLALFVLAELVRSIREKTIGDFIKRSGFGAFGLVLALSCNIGMLWTTYEYGKYTTRGKSELTIKPDGTSTADVSTGGLDRDYVTQYSYGQQEAFTLLVADAKGGASAYIGNDAGAMAKTPAPYRQTMAQMSRYWGDQISTSGPHYLGAIVILLLLLMLMGTEGAGRWWLLGSVPLLLFLIAVANAAPVGSTDAVTFMGLRSSLLSGVLVLGYLAAGLFLMKDTLVFGLFSAFLLTLMLSMGHNLMPLTDFFLDYVPGYNKFRAVTIILAIVELSVPVLAVLYLDRLVKSGAWDKRTERRNLIGMGVLVVVLLAMAFMPGNLFDFLSQQERETFTRQADSSPEMEAQVVVFVDALKQVRMGFFTSDVWRSFAFVIAGGALIFLFGRRIVGKVVLIAGIGVLMLLDQWTVDKRYISNAKERGRYLQWEDATAADMPFQADAADKRILDAEWNPAAEADLKLAIERVKEQKKDKSGRDKMVTPAETTLARFGSLRRNSHFRVWWLQNPFSDSRTSYFHKSLGGYHGAKLERYQEVIDFYLMPARARIGELLQGKTSVMQMDSLLAKEGVLNMLNARYIKYDDKATPILNTNALGAAWFVDELRWVKNADEEITALGTIDPARTVLIDERYRDAIGSAKATADPSSSVKLDSYRTNELTYTVRSGQGGVVVFSEIWYGPDWKASIDGQPVDYARADYILRALTGGQTPGGACAPTQDQAPTASKPIPLAGSLLVLLLVIGVVALELRPAKAEA